MSVQTRIYTTAGEAHFYCAGHPIHAGQHELARWLHPAAGHDLELAGGAHHLIVFRWAPGCVHIDDHIPERPGLRGHAVLRGCEQGCDEYLHVAGADPRAAGIFRYATLAELLGMARARGLVR